MTATTKRPNTNASARLVGLRLRLIPALGAMPLGIATSHARARTTRFTAGNASTLQSYFVTGAFSTTSTDLDPKEQLRVVRNRQMARRRRALKQAAAAAMAERARLAREAAGANINKGKGKGAVEEKEETCVICQCEFAVSGGDEGAGSLSCPGSHYMCGECTGVFVNSVLNDLETSYPPKCSMCRAEFPMEHFERQLTAKQQVDVKAHAARLTLKPGQELIKCTECDYFEISSANPVVWWCDACDKGTCFVCNKDLPRGVRKYDLDSSPHAICKTLRHAKALVEAAIESGSKMECPGCGLAGRKDDACTHMTCPKCTTSWCYVCGLSAKECDKAPPRTEEAPVDDIFLHNQDWETNEARCPMYLTQILEVDLGWLGENWEQEATNEDFEDDQKCLDFFHGFQTIRKLQEVRGSIGPEDFEAVFENFESVKNSGYSLEEIVSTSTEKLIDREEYLQKLCPSGGTWSSPSSECQWSFDRCLLGGRSMGRTSLCFGTEVCWNAFSGMGTVALSPAVPAG